MKTKPVRTICLASIAAFLYASHVVHAADLYDLNFSQPETGVYSVVFGNPTIQSSVGPFTDALLFHAVTGYDQIKLPINVPSPQYDIQFDAFVHNFRNSQYSFGLFIDAADGSVRSLYFHGGLNTLQAYQPFPITVSSLAGFQNDQAYHLDILLDLHANLWTVTLDGTQVFSNPLEATGLDSIRFSSAPWTGYNPVDAPSTYAALDNIVVTAVPEPSALVLGIAGVLALELYRTDRRPFISTVT